MSLEGRNGERSKKLIEADLRRHMGHGIQHRLFTSGWIIAMNMDAILSQFACFLRSCRRLCSPMSLHRCILAFEQVEVMRHCHGRCRINISLVSPKLEPAFISNPTDFNCVKVDGGSLLFLEMWMLLQHSANSCESRSISNRKPQPHATTEAALVSSTCFRATLLGENQVLGTESLNRDRYRQNGSRSSVL